MDICRLDAAESGEQRKHQRGGGKEYRAIRQEIGDEAHETGRDYPSHRGEALIASESFGERCVADQAKADRGNRQSKEATGDPLEHQRCEHQRETRPNRNNQRACCNHTGTERDRDSLRSDSIEQCTAGQLTEQSGESTCRQHKTDALWGPVSPGQKCGDVGTEARQSSSEKQVNGVEATQAGARWRWFNRIRQDCGIRGDDHFVQLRLFVARKARPRSGLAQATSRSPWRRWCIA